MNTNEICLITSCNNTLFTTGVYGKSLLTWNKIPYKKVMFSEDLLLLESFETIDLKKIINDTGFFSSKKRKGVVRRFYFKAISIHWALKNINSRFIVWLDSDVDVLKELTVFPKFDGQFASLFYADSAEIEKTPEFYHNGGLDTGMIIFDKEKLANEFADEYINYWHLETIFNLKKAKDAFVLKDLSTKYQASNLITNYKFIPSGSNYFSQTIFDEYLHHNIGRGNKN